MQSNKCPGLGCTSAVCRFISERKSTHYNHFCDLILYATVDSRGTNHISMLLSASHSEQGHLTLQGQVQASIQCVWSTQCWTTQR